jgi:DNA uptake protein ComE-like DNA-binding protein
LGFVAVVLGLAFAVPARAAAAKAASTQQVNLNIVTAKELEALPGVGAATAKTIIAGRPYTAVADLAKAGVPAKTITEITPSRDGRQARCPRRGGTRGSPLDERVSRT